MMVQQGTTKFKSFRPNGKARTNSPAHVVLKFGQVVQSAEPSAYNGRCVGSTPTLLIGDISMIMTEEDRKIVLTLKDEIEKIKVNMILENKKVDQIVSVLTKIIQKENNNA